MGCNDPPYDDAYLLRFLRARKFDLAKTLTMWNNFIKWRKENNVDEIDVGSFKLLNNLQNRNSYSVRLTRSNNSILMDILKLIRR